MFNNNDLPKPDLYVKSFHIAGVIFTPAYRNKGQLPEVHKELIEDIATEVKGTPLTLMVADNPEKYQGQKVDPTDNPYFVSLRLFQEFKAKEVNCKMDRTLLRDVTDNVASGCTFIAASMSSNLENNLQLPPPPPELDPSYVLTVYLQMWKRTTDEKEDSEKKGKNLPIIYFDFYGVTTGNNSLWDKLHLFFRSYPEHVPPNVCLRIFDCIGKPPKLIGQVIQGKGNINHNYKETVKTFLKLGCKDAGVFHPDNISGPIQKKLVQESKTEVPNVAVVNTAKQRLEEIRLVPKAPEMLNDDDLKVKEEKPPVFAALEEPNDEAKFEAVEKQSQAEEELTELQVDNLIFNMEISDLYSLLNQAKPEKLAALSEYFQKHGVRNISFSNLSSVLLQKAIFTRLNDLLRYERTLPAHLPRLIDTYINERAISKDEKVIDDFNSILVLLSRIPQGDLGMHRTGKNKSLDTLIVQFFKQKAVESLAKENDVQINAHRYQVEQHRVAGGILSGLDTVYYFQKNSSIQEKIDGIAANLQSELFNPNGYVRKNISKKELINNWKEFKASFLNKLRAELFLLVAQGQREEMRKEVLAIISQALFTHDCALHKVLHERDNKGLLAYMINAWEMANLIKKTKDSYVLQEGINVPQFPVSKEVVFKQEIIEEIAQKKELIEELPPQKELPVAPRKCTILQALLLIAQIEFSLSKLQEGDQKKKIEEFLGQLKNELNAYTKDFVKKQFENWFKDLRLQVVTGRYEDEYKKENSKVLECEKKHSASDPNYDYDLRMTVFKEIGNENLKLEKSDYHYRHICFSSFLTSIYENDNDSYQLDIYLLSENYQNFRESQEQEWQYLAIINDATPLEKLEDEYRQCKFNYLNGTLTSQAFASLKSIVEVIGKRDEEKDKENIYSIFKINKLYFFLEELITQTMFVVKENMLTSPQNQIICRVLGEVVAQKTVDQGQKKKIQAVLSALNRMSIIDLNKPFAFFEIDNFFDFNNPDDIFKKLIEEFNSPNFLSCVAALCKYSVHFACLFDSLSSTKGWNSGLWTKALKGTNITEDKAKDIVNQLLTKVLPYQMTRMTRLLMMLNELMKAVNMVADSVKEESINTHAKVSDYIVISNLCVWLSEQIVAIDSHLAISSSNQRFSLTVAPQYWNDIETSSNENLEAILEVFQSRFVAINGSDYIEMLNRRELARHKDWGKPRNDKELAKKIDAVAKSYQPLKISAPSVIGNKEETPEERYRKLLASFHSNQEKNSGSDIAKGEEAQTSYSQLGFRHTPKEMVDELLNSIRMACHKQNQKLSELAKAHKSGNVELIDELKQNAPSFKLLCTITSYLENERKKYPDEENQEQEEEKVLNNSQCRR